jgi:hypothetical protein
MTVRLSVKTRRQKYTTDRGQTKVVSDVALDLVLFKKYQ